MGWTLPTPNGRWISRYRTPDGDTRSKTYDRKGDAERWLRAELRRIDQGDWIDPKAGLVNLNTILATYLDSRPDLRPSSRARDNSYIHSLIQPRFGNTPISAISAQLVQSWVADLVLEGYAPETVRKANQILSACLRSAVQQNWIAKNPCDSVKLPRVEKNDMRFLGQEEVHSLAAGIDPRWRAMVYVGAYGGLRFGEAAGLTRTSLDLRANTLTVVKTLSEVSGRPPTLTEPKTKASRRTLGLPGFLVRELEVHMLSNRGAEFVFEAPNGGPIRGTNWRRRIWKPAVSATVGDPMRFHDLRHTHVAQLIRQGEHPKLIQSRLGHESITTTMDRYGHLFQGTDMELAQRLDDAISVTSAQPARIHLVA